MQGRFLVASCRAMPGPSKKFLLSHRSRSDVSATMSAFDWWAGILYHNACSIEEKKKQRLSTSIACPMVSEVCAALPRVLQTAPVKSQCFYASRLFLASNSFYVITCPFLFYLTFVNIYAKLLCPFAWTVFSHVLRTCVGSNKFFDTSFTASQVPV